VRALAAAITEAQQEEIARMQGLLNR